MLVVLGDLLTRNLGGTPLVAIHVEMNTYYGEAVIEFNIHREGGKEGFQPGPLPYFTGKKPKIAVHPGNQSPEERGDALSFVHAGFDMVMVILGIYAKGLLAFDKFLVGFHQLCRFTAYKMSSIRGDTNRNSEF